MKYLFKTAVIAAIASVSLMSPGKAHAASQDECAIWICLPGAFAFPECSRAYSAMVRRITRFKPPLPLFGACSVDNPRGGDYNYVRNYCREPHHTSRRVRGTLAICRDPYTGRGYMTSTRNIYHHVDVTVDGKEFDTYTFTTRR